MEKELNEQYIPTSLEKLNERWCQIIRAKAEEYEVGSKIPVTQPDLYDIANEIDAFFTGLENKWKKF